MIEFDNVTKRFGATLAVDRFSCRYEAGRTHVLLGSSGCGKTTLLRIALGLERPDSGTVMVGANGNTAQNVGYVVQSGGLFPHLTVRQNVALAVEVRRWPKDRIEQRIDELQQLVGFDADIMLRYPAEVSGGQQQRVSLMRALMPDPPVLLLDEPLGSLDPLVRDDLQRELRQIFRRLEKTVLFVTHDIREAAMIGDTITLMTDGQLVQHGRFRELAENPANGFVRRFLEAQTLPAEA